MKYYMLHECKKLCKIFSYIWHKSQSIECMTYATGFQSYLKNNAICYGHRIVLAVNFYTR